MKSIAIIPARGGSKRIHKKNIKDFLGKPIIYYSIKAALDSKIFDTVMVSTEDEQIAEIARRYGAEVPFFRTQATASDYATTEDVITEVINEYKSAGRMYDIICCLYPTAPFVTASKLCEAMNSLANSTADSIIPIVKYSYPPQRSFALKDEKIIMNYPEHLKTRSQDLNDWYHDCGQFYYVKASVFMACGEILTSNTIPFVLPEAEVQDIDNEQDWKLAEMKYRMMQNPFVNKP